MEDEIQVVPLDLSMTTGVLRQNKEEIGDATDEEIIDVVTTDEIVPQNESLLSHSISKLVTSSAHAPAQEEIWENKSQEKIYEELDSVGPSQTKKFVIGSPDCSSCNNIRYFESIIANVEKKIDGLKKSMKNKPDPEQKSFELGPNLVGSREVKEHLFHQFQGHPYAKPPETYKKYYAKETKHLETIKIYDLGYVDDKQKIVEIPENAKQERRNDTHIISTVKDGQYLVPQLHIREEASRCIPIIPRSENWVPSTNVEFGCYDTYSLHGNRMLPRKVLPEVQNYRQPIRTGFSSEELGELLTEINSIEAYVATMDKDGNSKAYTVERFCPEYWAFLTNKLIKIKNDYYLLHGFHDTYCDKILTRVNTLGKFPQEYWCPAHKPSTVEGCSRHVPQEGGNPKIVLKLARNGKERRKYTRRGGRQRRKNPEGSWSVTQTEISYQPQNVVQALEPSAAKPKDREQPMLTYYQENK